jgi:hypothetical protein
LAWAALWADLNACYAQRYYCGSGAAPPGGKANHAANGMFGVVAVLIPDDRRNGTDPAFAESYRLLAVASK